MEALTLRARAKINLILDVLKRREDGYHEVRMVMQSVELFDELTFRKASRPGIYLKADTPDVPTDERNLIVKAAKLLLDPKKDGVEISLKKVIPIEAGMAGGSTDAAAALNGINELFSLGKSKEELMALGVRIGADVPYCIMGGTALAEGIGEILTPLTSPPECMLLIAKPAVGVSTKFVYENLHVDQIAVHPDVDAVLRDLEAGNLEAMAEHMENILEKVTISRYPVIDEIKNVMMSFGARIALMSGSGPTVFGLFTDGEALNRAKAVIAEKQLAMQVYETTFAREA